MASVYDVVEALQAMGLEMRALGDEAGKTAEKVREARAEGESTTSGVTKASGPVGVDVTSMSATDLGNPRDAVDQGMRIYAAIEAAKRR